MKYILKILVLFCSLCTLQSCTKTDEPAPTYGINNTTWKADITITGNSTTDNIFEFANNGAAFAWHPAGSASFSGSWSQHKDTINFTFKEISTTTGFLYDWDNTGTLSPDGKTITGTMQRRGAQGAGTFVARKM